MTRAEWLVRLNALYAEHAVKWPVKYTTVRRNGTKLGQLRILQPGTGRGWRKAPDFCGSMDAARLGIGRMAGDNYVCEVQDMGAVTRVKVVREEVECEDAPRFSQDDLRGMIMVRKPVVCAEVKRLRGEAPLAMVLAVLQALQIEIPEEPMR